VLFHVRLYQLNSHLRENYPKMWKLFGSGNESMSRTEQYRCITRLSTEFEVSDENLNQRFVMLRTLHRSSALGALVLLSGLLYEVFLRAS